MSELRLLSARTSSTVADRYMHKQTTATGVRGMQLSEKALAMRQAAEAFASADWRARQAPWLESANASRTSAYRRYHQLVEAYANTSRGRAQARGFETHKKKAPEPRPEPNGKEASSHLKKKREAAKRSILIVVSSLIVLVCCACWYALRAILVDARNSLIDDAKPNAYSKDEVPLHV